jgi:hypothetical protein
MIDARYRGTSPALAGNSLSNEIANWLSSKVTSTAEKNAPPIIAQSLDLFVRQTPGGKIIMNKISFGTMVVPLGLGLAIGYMLCRRKQ